MKTRARYGVVELDPITPVGQDEMIILLHWLGRFTYQPMQAEHLMVILRGQTVKPESAKPTGM